MKRLVLLGLLSRIALLPVWARGGFGALVARAQKASVGLSCRGPGGRYFGTGTIVGPDGLILTSSTVLPPGATDIEATLSDGRVLRAELLSVDPAVEFALAKIQGQPFPYLPIGSSARVEVGERVVSLGNAFESARAEGQVSVGAGIVSGRYRLKETRGEATYRGEVLETDAPLNPGSDGGALIDMAGTVVGVLSLNYSPMRLLGTAVPVDVLKEKIRPQLGAVSVRSRAPGFLSERFALTPAALKRWEGAVVSLRVERSSDEKADLGILPPDLVPWRRPPFRRGPDILARPKGPVSGVCVDPAGLVLTARYNVAGTVRRVEVRDTEGVWHPARIVARDPVDDLALLQAEGGSWSAAPRAEPGPIVVGKAVFVLGRSPAPDHLTATAGMVSAVERNAGRLFQHDAAQNPGNTGGAVIDREGGFLGIAVFVGHLWPEWAANSGIGFAVRPDCLSKVLPTLRQGKDVAPPELPFLGVGRRAVEAGKVTVNVLPGHAASKAGIQNGDRIVKIGDRPIQTWLDLRRAIAAHRVGEKVAVVIERNSAQKTVEVILGARPKGR